MEGFTWEEPRGQGSRRWDSKGSLGLERDPTEFLGQEHRRRREILIEINPWDQTLGIFVMRGVHYVLRLLKSQMSSVDTLIDHWVEWAPSQGSFGDSGWVS